MNYGALSSIPRKTTIGGQPHMLAYINPKEESLIQEYRGNLPPVAGPDGVPAYLFGFSWGGGGGSTASSSSSNDDDDDSPGFFESIGNAISSGASAVTNAVSNTVSSAVDFVSDVGSAAVDVVSNIGSAASDTVQEIVTLGAADTETYNAATTKSFDDAFSEARDAGLETFTWQGDVYTTDLATAPDPTNLQNIDSQLADLYSQGFTANDPPVKALLEKKNAELSILEQKLEEGQNQVQDYIDKYGTTYLEDRFLTGLINPATGLPYPARDTNIVNPLDADTMPYTPGGLDDDEIIYLGGDPYSSTVDGVDIGTGSSSSVSTTDQADGVIDSGAYLANNFGSGAQPYSTDIFGTRDLMGDFYGGRSGGMWDRFLGSYLTRFGYSPEGFDEMVRKVENPDGTVNFFGADGQLIDPESIGSNYRLTGDPTPLKIGEEQVKIGSQDYDAQGNLLSTNYTAAYDPELDKNILAQG
jgi:hypothetical protein